MNRIAKAISFIFWVLATGLYLTAMLTNYWVSTRTSYNYGVFYKCLFAECSFVEWSPTVQNQFMTIPRIILLVGAAWIIVGTLIGFFGVFGKNNCPIITEGAFNVIGGIIILAACGTFTALNINDEGDDFLKKLFNIVVDSVTQRSFHYSFYFGWISGVLYVISGICAMAAGRSYD